MRFPFTVLLLLCVVAAPALHAQDGATVPSTHFAGAVQGATGVGFDDAAFGFNTRTGRMSLVGLTVGADSPRMSHALLLFVLQGDFQDGVGQPSAEATRLSVEWTTQWHVLGTNGPGSSVYVAGQLYRDGADFRADLAGVGAHTRVRGVDLWLTQFARLIEGGGRDWKTRAEWEAPFTIGQLRARVNGYVDATFHAGAAAEWSGVSQLLVRSGRWFGQRDDQVELGLKWFNHLSPVRTTSAPMLMLRWAL